MMFLGQFQHASRETVFPRNLCRHGKVINLLVLLKVLEELILVYLVVYVSEPAYRKVITRFRLLKTIALESKFHQTIVAQDHFK